MFHPFYSCSCFAKHLTFRLSGTECNVSLVSDEDGAIVDDHWIAKDESSECYMLKGSSSKEKQVIWPNTGKETEPEPLEENEAGHNLPCSNFSSRVSEADFSVRRPQELSWEEIIQITKRFSTRTRTEHEKNYSTYIGYFDHQSVFVKRFVPHSGCILEAEMRAALFIYHKNIMVITGYHQSENGTILIFPLLQGMSLDRYIWGECTPICITLPFKCSL